MIRVLVVARSELERAGLEALLGSRGHVAVGGGPAFAVKSCVTEPAAVALTTWAEAVPRLSTVVATPLEFVVLCAGLRPPPPVVMVQVTTMPGTAQLFASRAVTL